MEAFVLMVSRIVVPVVVAFMIAVRVRHFGVRDQPHVMITAISFFLSAISIPL